jgi:hypothetical protein
VTGEESFFARKVPARLGTLARLDFEHFIDEQKWGTVRQDIFSIEHGRSR